MRLDTFEERLVWARRNHAKLTQKELTKKMEEEFSVSVGPNYISVIEVGGEKRPTFEVVRAMAGAMKVSLDWLAIFTEDYAIQQNKETDATYFSPEADEAAQLIDKMPAERRGLVVTLVKNLATAQAPDQQRRIEEAKDILDSIEKKLGWDTRVEVEQIMRSKGIAVDGTV